MLDVAAGLSPDDSRLTWLACDATSLPFLNATFDALVCQFGVMFFPDKPKAFSEAARVLRKDGTFLFNVWDRIAANDFVAIATDVLTKRFPDDPPQFMERVPHGVFDTDLLTKQLQTAGFAKVDVDVVEYISKSATPMDAATAYCQGTPLRNEILARDPDGLGRCTQAVATALQSHLGPGPIKGKIRAFVLTASKA
jgi:ubiquinone/menaquinone biosynthesis C-methylase UbiE